MNKVSDLRDLCQLWADDVASFEEQGRIDRVTADALARFARSFFTGLVSVAGVRRLVPGRGALLAVPVGKTEGPNRKKSVVESVWQAEEENKAKTECALDLWNFAKTEGETFGES